MQSFIIIDNASGEVFRMEAASYIGALEQYIGNLEVDIREEAEFAEAEPQLYSDWIAEGVL